jgi:phosphatidylserine decarboxylase
VLNEPVSRLDQETLVVPWLGKVAKAEMVKVANEAVGEGPNPTPGSFEQIFECEPATRIPRFQLLGRLLHPPFSGRGAAGICADG